MLESMARSFLRAFLSREQVLHRLFPVGLGIGGAAAMVLPASVIVPAMIMLLFWSMHLEAEIQETLLPKEAYLDAIAYRGHFYYVLAAMALLGGAHLMLPVDGFGALLSPERLSLAIAFLSLALVHTAGRSVEVAEIGETFLATRRLENHGMIVMRSRFSRWLTSGRVFWFLRGRDDRRDDR